MSVVHLLVSLLLEGALWAIASACVLSATQKIDEEAFRRWINPLIPVWAGASLVTVLGFGIEAFVAVYGMSEHEEISVVGHVLPQSPAWVQIAASASVYLLPSLLFFRGPRGCKLIVYAITGLCLLGIVVLPRLFAALAPETD